MNIKKLFFSIAMAMGIFFHAVIRAQDKSTPILILGYVYDNFTGAGIKDAKVTLMDKDSTVIGESPTYIGNFMHGGTNGIDASYDFEIGKNKSIKSYIIKVEHPDYYTTYTNLSLKHIGKMTRVEVPDILVKRRNSFLDRMLDDVSVVATKVKVLYKGDTIVYNADAFNVADGSMLDALIKQLPGVELNKNGEIFVNGRKIDNLLLNGKDFFRGNNRMMLENLPYYTVKDIKVYDRTTDKAVALNDKDAPKDFVMDVYLKKEYSKGYMANVELGAGTEDSYLARLFGLRFTDHTRFTIVGGANNMNMDDYTLGGYITGGQPRNGRTDSKRLLAERLYEHHDCKNVLTLEVLRKKTDAGSDEYQETFLGDDKSTFSISRYSNVDKNIEFNANNHFTLKKPFWFESKTKFSVNDSKNTNEERYSNSRRNIWQDGIGMLDSLYNLGVSVNDTLMLNARRRTNAGKTKAYEASQSFNVSRKVFDADIIDFNAGVDYTKRTFDNDRTDNYLLFRPEYSRQDVMEYIDKPSTHIGVNADLTYKFCRLFSRAGMSAFVRYRHNDDKGNETITDINTAAIDIDNSYDKKTKENVYVAGVDYHYSRFSMPGGEMTFTNFDWSIPCTFVDRKTYYNRSVVDRCIEQTPFFVDPSVSFSVKRLYDNQSTSEKWRYNISTSLKHNITDPLMMIELPVTSDRINIFSGNGNLKNSSAWTSNFSWYRAINNRKNGFLRYELDYTMFLDRIINTYSYNALTGVYNNKPENVNGTWNISSRLTGEHYFQDLKFIFRWRMYSLFNKMKNSIVDEETGSAQMVNNNGLHSEIPLTFVARMLDKKLWVDFTASISWDKSFNNRANVSYEDAIAYHTSFYVSGNFSFLDFNTGVDVIKRSGYSNDELNKVSFIWDANVSKSILKGKVVLKLSAIDILHQYKSLAYVTNERGIRETHAVSLPAYVLFSTSYRFNKSPVKKK